MQENMWARLCDSYPWHAHNSRNLAPSPHIFLHFCTNLPSRANPWTWTGNPKNEGNIPSEVGFPRAGKKSESEARDYGRRIFASICGPRSICEPYSQNRLN